LHRLLKTGAGLIARAACFAGSPAWLNTATPTADIYFLNAMAGFVRREGGLHPLGPNVYRCGARFVILRYATEEELRAVEAARREAVFYVVDDDLEALAASPDLPAGYRRRLAAFVTGTLPRILRLCDVVLAPNELLLERFRRHTTGLLHPSYCAICDDFSHFEHASPLRIVFTGTRSHLCDLQAIAPALARLCGADRQVELATFLGRWAPPDLRGRNIVHLAPLGWTQYRELLGSARFHVALAPFRAVPTNECRSHNKIHDHAAFGAAGLYGDITPYSRTVSHGSNGLLLAAEAGIWLEALLGLVADPQAARRLAEAGAALSREIGSPDRLRRFWCEVLGLSSS
jgi:hypothetical protein